MNLQCNLAYANDDWDYTESHKSNVVAFPRQKGHGIVEAKKEDKIMRNFEKKKMDGNKAVILVRVSSREQKEGYSIDAQLARLRTYCERKNLEIIKNLLL